MKVQFDGGGIRLRVSRDELRSLRTGMPIRAAIEWPDGGWAVEVAPAACAAAEAAGRTLRVAFTSADLEALDNRLPARDGLRAVLDLPAGPVDVRFEVDLHDGRARRR